MSDLIMYVPAWDTLLRGVRGSIKIKQPTRLRFQAALSHYSSSSVAICGRLCPDVPSGTCVPDLVFAD